MSRLSSTEDGLFKPRLIGLLMIVTAVLINQRSLERVLSADEFIGSLSRLVPIWTAQATLLIVGFFLLLRGLRARIPWVLRALVVLGLAGGCAIGLYGTGYVLEWYQPPIRLVPDYCDWLTGGTAPFFGRAEIETLPGRLAALERSSGNEHEQLQMRSKLAKSLLGHGRVSDSIAEYEKALAYAVENAMSIEVLNGLHRALGVAYYRRGEVKHCVTLHNRESCIFPLRRGGVHADPHSAEQAIEQFREVLKTEPDDPAARWLLNVAHMAAGTFPDGLSEYERLPDAVVNAVGPAPRFRDIAPDLGLDSVNLVGGAVLEDFDNDGFLDVATSTYDPCQSMLFFHNNGDGTFADWSERSGLISQKGGFNLVQADYNNDGRVDLYVIRGAWMGPWGRQLNSLLRQESDGTFTDVTEEAGLGATAYPTLAAAWADYDNDGDLDLFVGNERITPHQVAPSELFRNDGDGTFTEVGRAAGLQNRRNVKAMSWGDYDNDGDIDLYVSNHGDPNRLYRNDGDGTFTDVAPELGVDRQDPSNKTFGTWFFDYDNDGWLDLFVGGYVPKSLGEVAADYLGMPTTIEKLHLYRNDGTGQFIDVSEEAGLAHVRSPMGANYGDIDNDGYLDIYLGTGAPQFEHLVPNVIYRNISGREFADVTASTGLGHLQKGHSIAFGDLDNDGDQDIFAQMGGFLPDDAFANSVFENPGSTNHWITIRLVGEESNRFGVGARIRLVVDENGRERSIHRLAGSGGSFGSSSLQQEIGLGSAALIREIEVFWPASGLRQRFHDIAVDQVIEVAENRNAYRLVEARPIRLTGAPAAP